jgi:zinc protease
MQPAKQIESRKGTRGSGFGVRGSGLLVCAGLLLGLAALSAAREFPPEVPPPAAIVLPTPQVRELPNGLKVVVIERHSLPLVTLRLVVESGAEADPPALPGTAQLAAGLLSQGTARRSAREIAEAVDLVGGSLETGAEWDSSFASLTMLSDHTELAFDLLADVVLHPGFPPAEIERKRQQTLSALEVVREDPDDLADTVFDLLIFSGTPYGHPEDGTEESVRRITARDLEAFHEQHYRPSNCVLAAVGDITADQALTLARKFFGDWEGRPLPPRLADAVATTQPRRIVIIDKPDAVQTEIRVGNLAIRRDSPDYYALTVANQILGGPAANRLFKALRSQQGLTYGASSDLLCQQTLGSWVAKTSTRTAETARTVEQVLEQMEQLRNRPITTWELQTAHSYLVGHMALEFESSDDIAAQFLELMAHDLPLDYWSRFPHKIQAVGTDEVLRATRRYLDPERNVIVLVGSAAGFSRELDKLGPYTVIPLRDLDLGSPNLVRAAPAAAR